jgi:SAM-dependent methyltransferase
MIGRVERKLMSEETAALLRCPRCGDALDRKDRSYDCLADACGASYPMKNGIAILIDERRSVFTIAELAESEPFFRPRSFLGPLIDRLVPSTGLSLASRDCLRRFRGLLQKSSDSPRILVIGGSILGDGMEELLAAGIELVESDVSFGPRTQLIFDAHVIPFSGGSFDGVVAQAVLEHVADPATVVEELHRVLKPAGMVYAEIPFMQQVHGGAYDFTRFTHLGCLRLFRKFTEIASGANAGPGTALAWSYDYFLSSFITSLRLRPFVRLFVRLTAFWLKYFDRLVDGKPGALDAASVIYFLGRRSESVRSDREIVQQYRGSNPPLQKSV